MPLYVGLYNWTNEGIRNVKDSPKRAQAARALAEKLGGKVIGVYYTMGQYDLISVGEFPNEETAMRFAFELGRQGSVRSTTLRAYSEAEAAKVIASLS